MGKNQLFLFKGRPVGYFTRSEFPREPGRYGYIPFQGPGQDEMQTRFQAGDRPRCYYITGQGFVSFTEDQPPVPGGYQICKLRTIGW